MVAGIVSANGDSDILAACTVVTNRHQLQCGSVFQGEPSQMGLRVQPTVFSAVRGL